MDYKKETLSMEEAWNRAGQYPYILAYQTDGILLGRTEEISISRQALTEARFFSETGELHMFQCEREWTAVEIEDKADAKPEEKDVTSITRSYRLSKRFRMVGRELMVKDYLSADEDGQVFVELSRLCGLE